MLSNHDLNLQVFKLLFSSFLKSNALNIHNCFMTDPCAFQNANFLHFKEAYVDYMELGVEKRPMSERQEGNQI